MRDFDKVCGRIQVYSYSHASPRPVTVSMDYNGSYQTDLTMTLDEAIDLRYLLDRLIAQAQP